MSSFFNTTTPLKSKRSTIKSPSLSKRITGCSPGISFSPLPVQNSKKHRPSFSPLSSSSVSTASLSEISQYASDFVDGNDDSFRRVSLNSCYSDDDAEVDSSSVLRNGQGQSISVEWKPRKDIDNVTKRTLRRRRRKVLSETAAAAQLRPEVLEDAFKHWASIDPTFSDMLKRVVLEEELPQPEAISRASPYFEVQKQCIDRCVRNILPGITNGEIDIACVKTSLENCMREMRAGEETKRTNILARGTSTSNDDIDPSVAATYEKCQTLKHYFIPNNPRVIDNIFRDAVKMNQARHLSKNILIDNGNNVKTAYVGFPRAKDSQTLKAASRKYKLLESITKAIDKKGNESAEARKAFINVLFDDDDYGPLVQEKLLEDGFSCIQTIDPVTSCAILSDIGLTQTQIRRLRRLLRAHFGSPIFASYEKMYEALGDAYVEPVTGVHKVNRTRVYYSVKPVDKMLENFVLELQESAHDFDHVDLSINIDHGQGYLRATMTLAARKLGDTTKDWKETFSVASAKCKGDTYDILAKTFAPHINEALWRIRNAGFYVNVWEKETSVDSITEESTKYWFTLGDDQSIEGYKRVRCVKVENWMNGDLKFFMQATCRENACGYWCFYCKLGQPSWTAMERSNVDNVERWTNTKIEQYLKELELRFVDEADLSDVDKVQDKCAFSKLSTQERMGFKAGHRLIFNAVEIDHFVPPYLHFLLGLANDAERNFISELQAGFETFTDEYFRLERELQFASDNIRVARKTRNAFDSVLTAWKRESKEEMKLPLLQRASGMSDDEIKADIDDMEYELQTLKDAVKAAEKERDDIKSEFDEESKLPENSPALGQPLRDYFESVCKEKQINFAEFHGRGMQGNASRRFLEHRIYIVNKMRDYVLALPEEQKQETDSAAIDHMFDLHLKLFGHMDAYMSFLRTTRYSLQGEARETALALAKQHRDRMNKIWIHLGLSHTPKNHLGDHMIQHFEGIDDGNSDWTGSEGLSDIAEDDGERAHQEGVQMARRMGRNVNQKQVARSIAKADACEKNTKVVSKRLELYNSSKRNFKKPQKTKTDSDEEKRAVRVSARNALLLMPFELPTGYKSLKQRKMDRNRNSRRSDDDDSLF